MFFPDSSVLWLHFCVCVNSFLLAYGHVALELRYTSHSLRGESGAVVVVIGWGGGVMVLGCSTPLFARPTLFPMKVMPHARAFCHVAIFKVPEPFLQ